uniref:Glycosyl transferase n=1 Tax=Panagrellus redivivus TaxID=6233 RepID=A0A7E5A291_PANRE
MIAYTTIVLFGPQLLNFLYNVFFVVPLLNRPKDLRRLAGIGANWVVISGGSEGLARLMRLFHFPDIVITVSTEGECNKVAD